MANRASAIDVISRGDAPSGSPRPVYQEKPRYITTQRDLAWYGLHSHGYKVYYHAAIAILEEPFASAGDTSNKIDTSNNPYFNGTICLFLVLIGTKRKRGGKTNRFKNRFKT
jgi:hypothetical protein